MDTKINLDENQLKLLNERYFLTLADGTKENWEDLALRVAKAIAKGSDKFNDREYNTEVMEYYLAIKSMEFMPATPILMNAGTEKQQLFSCFISEISDNLESIYAELGLSAKIFAGAGGIGYNFGNLRPEGSKVSTRGLSSGVMSFMELFNVSCGIIKIGAGSRRGAMLACLPVDHPEIMEFIKCKNNTKKLTNFNISVWLTDDFMAAVKMDGEYELKTFKNNPEKKTLSARKVFNAIVHQAWKNGEPGVLFDGNINKYNPVPKMGRMISANPSLRKGTKIITKEYGLTNIEELENKDFTIFNLDGNKSPAKCFLSGENKQLIKLTLRGNHVYYCTKEHKWPVLFNDRIIKKSTDSLCVGDLLPITKLNKISDGNLGNYDDGFLCGWIYGDGHILKRSDNNKLQIGITVSEEKYNIGIGEYLSAILQSNTNISGNIFNKRERIINNKLSVCYEFNSTNSSFIQYIKQFGIENKQQIPLKIWNDCSENYRRGFIDGVFSADGYVSNIECDKHKSGRLLLTSSNSNFITEISMLLSLYGIKNNINSSKTTNIKFPNGKTYNKTYYRYDLWITNYTSILRFREIFKFTHKTKQQKLNNIYSTKKIFDNKINNFIEIVAIEQTDIFEDVYDISVFDNTHCFSLPHCITGNCSEIVGINGSVCCLGHVNFNKLFTEDNMFDFIKFEKLIRLGIRFLDNCIDINLYPHDKFKKVAKDTRVIGLGYMGFADALVRLNIKYGSPECFEFINKIGEFFQTISHDESFKIAEKRGVYPAFEGKTPLRRNASTNMVAPCGSVGMIANASYGIEPIYALHYVKNCMDGTELTYTHPYFMEKINNHPEKSAIMEYVNKYGTLRGIGKSIEQEFSNFVVASDINPKDRIKTQSCWQKYIDLSISSTCNLPESATKEECADLYMRAWEYGCKGLTLYRDGSRSQQVLNIEKVRNTWTCDNCGKIHDIDSNIDPTTICIKCSCGYKSCS